ncbi:MAG: transcriptional regulator, LacI family [Polyangiaceae bacterium]|jgi:DNA-binding LacI/PurR family transcriptional regulator|nr:transcriptional regulator, LacI family [Polyangiaceae bacterium]
MRPLEKRPRVTITDLAEMLGMDKSSVSLALRDSPKVSLATRARVRQAAAEHNYIPNWAAKRLAGSSGHAVGLVMPSAFGCLTDPPVVRTAQALARLAANRQLTLNLMAHEQLAESNGENSLPLHADGLLVWGDVPAPAAVRFSSAYARPSIVLDPHHPSYAKYKGNTIAIDNRGGASALVRHLHERGTKTLTFVQVEDLHLSHVARWKGTQETWQELAKAETLTKLTLAELDDDKLRELAERGEAGVFCSNDHGAMQLWHRMRRLGISAPRDLRLVGFDGDEYGELVGLTTAVFDSELMAETAFTRLIGLLSNQLTTVTESIPVTVRTGTTS